MDGAQPNWPNSLDQRCTALPDAIQSCHLAAVNRTMRTPVEGPSIGVLLCESRSGPMVEFVRTQIRRSAYPRIKSLASCRHPCRRSCRASRTWRRWSTSFVRRWRRCRGSRPMKNNPFFIKGNVGIARPGQFGNGPLPNWNLSTHRPDETSRTRNHPAQSR